MTDVPTIPVGSAVDTAIQWLTTHAGGLFDAISAVLFFLVNLIYGVLAAPPSLVLVVIFGALAALCVRSVGMTVFAVLAFLLIDSMQLWHQMLQTLSVVVLAALIAIVVGVPVGVLAAKSPKTGLVVRPVLDFMQTLPVFVYLVPAVFFFGIGVVPGIVSTTVFAVPPAVRLTELGIRQVDRETVEAARAFGARPRQVLREVELPLAVPSIMAGVNQVIMLALSMVVVAGLVGAEGLGGVVVEGVTQLNIGAAFEGGIAVVILAVYLDRITSAAGRGRKRRKRTARTVPTRRFGGRRELSPESSDNLVATH
ncbi:glycine betaine/proline transport system permease protein [Saccharomonospora viridis]|uniref:ABC-type proline/glycine betaine transport system, permease component n=2 Tax=Saccharomonospora viridis TaxID=1852 RepID=C7N073_SACVD|nr:ABC-type proline/glycine betaine transport system, permease component [Saccharomonospora viridis DSM 43017]KHF42148.1 glycine/betaine ABC transporter permease [Saccharomonospora viridis]SFP48112.1 glycine betaine/proline transport system permease protein [Saccharomonospora viridis]